MAGLTLGAAAAILMATWRYASQLLALVGLAALIGLALWSYATLPSVSTPAQAISETGASLRFALIDGVPAFLRTTEQTSFDDMTPILVSAIPFGVVVIWLCISLLRRRHASAPPSMQLPIKAAAARLGRWLTAILAAGLIVAVFQRTAVPIDLARLSAAALGEARLPMLVFAMTVGVGTGLIMPGIAAFLLTVALLDPALRTVGLSDHLTYPFVLLATLSGVGIRFWWRSRSVAAPAGNRALAPEISERV